MIVFKNSYNTRNRKPFNLLNSNKVLKNYRFSKLFRHFSQENINSFCEKKTIAKADCVVIGGGIIGCASSYFIKKYNPGRLFYYF